MTQDEPQVTVGVVTAANERGFQLQGREAWYNWSKWAPEPRLYPTPGDHIVASLDKDGYVRKVVLGNGKLAREAAVTVTTARPSIGMPLAPEIAIEPTTGRALTKVSNPQLDREFRLRCLTLAGKWYPYEITAENNLPEIMQLADGIAAWAEGREA